MRPLRYLIATTLLPIVAGCGHDTEPPAAAAALVTPANGTAYSTTPVAHAPTDVYVTIPINTNEPEVLKWLSWQKVRLEKDSNGDARVYDAPDCRRALVQYRRMLALRASVTIDNITNADVIVDDRGELNPYKRQQVTIDAGGTVEIKTDAAQAREVYDPSSPYANAKGFVKYPGVNVQQETAMLSQTAAELALVDEILQHFDPSYMSSKARATSTSADVTSDEFAHTPSLAH